MRPVLHSDVAATARVLLRYPRHMRQQLMRQMLEQANTAGLYFKRLKRGHPVWGNGSLMAVALAQDMAPEPFLDDPEYCHCFVVVFEELIRWRCERASFNQPRKTRRLQQSGQAPVA